MTMTRLAVALGLLSTTMWVFNCNLVVDTSKTQCANDGECRSLGADFEGSFCGADKVCTRAVDYCFTNSECIDRTGSEATICRKSDHKCVGLLTKNCKLLADKDDLRDDNTVIFGSHGIPSWAAPVLACEFGLELVRRDLKSTQGGLPPTPNTNGKPRPVVFLSCDVPIGQQELHKPISDHLFDAVQVPMMIGPFATVDFITYGVQKLPSHNTTIFTVESDQPAFEINGRQGKFFSYGFPKGGIVKQQVRGVSLVEQVIRKLGKTDDLKLAYLYQGVGVTDNDAKLFSEQVRFNNKGALEQPTLYREFAYGSPSGANFSEGASNAAVQVKAFAPDIILYRGSDEVTAVASLIEQQLPGKAYHIFPIEGRNGTPAFVGGNPGLRKRTIGFRPGRFEQDPRVLRLNARYGSLFGQEAPPSPLMRACVDLSYHAIYAAGAVKGDVVTGPAIGEALNTRFKLDGVPVDATPSGIIKAFNTLQSGQNLRVQGNEADGIWDPVTGVNADLSTQYWCVNPNPQTGADPLMDTGVYYNSLTDTVTGTADLIASCLK